MYRLRLTAALSGLCGFSLLCLPILSQQSPPAPPPKAPQSQKPPSQQTGDPTAQFFGGVNEVIVPVTAKDDRGKFVSNLTRDDFRVLDEGKPQRIEFFSHDQRQPVVVGFLVDQSNNMKIHWKVYQDALKEL